MPSSAILCRLPSGGQLHGLLPTTALKLDRHSRDCNIAKRGILGHCGAQRARVLFRVDIARKFGVEADHVRRSALRPSPQLILAHIDFSGGTAWAHAGVVALLPFAALDYEIVSHVGDLFLASAQPVPWNNRFNVHIENLINSLYPLAYVAALGYGSDVVESDVAGE